ncbi:UNVERIFIED_CONTAM: hypothetical protein FKN15_057522 [Acipenser sinensis]
MGVEGRPLDEITATSRGYQLLVNSTAVKISIPFGAVGGYRKSHVIDNKYNQMYAIDLFLEHQWADDLWEPVHSPYLPETPYVVNNTIPSEKGFTVTLGNFKPDVELKNLTINGVPLTLPEAENRGVKITEVKHPNGTKDFVLKVPFAHPLIPEQYIGDNYRRYLLNINYTLNIIPVNEPYFHPATIVCDVQDVGNMDYQWELCIGEEPLTPELVARRGYTMTSQPKIRVELPLFSIGYIYEDITLRGLIGKVVLILRDMKSLKEEDRFEQRCPFPTNEMLVCMPNGVMSVLVVPMAPVPPVNLARTTLLDQNCRPTEATSDRALFTFRVNACGTRSKIDKNYLVYENEVIYSRELFPANAPVITRDSEYSCLVTGDSYRTLFHPVPARTSPHLQRLEVHAQQSSKDPALWRQVYFHCMAVVCDPNLEDTCNKTCVPGEKRSGNFVTECRDRYFWMSTNGRFAGGSFRFDVIDGNGIHPLNDSYAATCGFTYSFNLPGDLIFRASFLACHVQSMNDVSYVLQYRFVRMDSLGRATVYPFSLSCSTESAWNPREVVCEENYMEVSVRKNVPVIAQEGLAKEDWEAALSIAQEAVMSVWQVVFHQTGMTPKTMNAADARTEGYFINSTTSRVVFRSPYGMPKSEVVMVAGIPVEAIRATVFYKQRWMLLLVDTSAACAKNPSVFDGTYLSWVTPRLLSPLVLHPTKFVDKQIKMGVEGRPLDEITATSRGYQLLVNSTAVKISIPFGAVGGYRKSHVIDNKYNQMYAIDLFLEHQWADDLWEVTQHRSFKPVRSPYLPETPYVVNNTIPSEKGFTVTLGNFKPDVELKNLTINGVPLTLPEAENRGVKITEVKHPNGTKNFVLKVPFAHPLIPEQIDKNYLVYENEVIYSRELFPANAPVITRDSEYRLTIRCRYPVSDSRKIFAERKLVPAPGSFTAKGEGTLQLQSAYYSGDKRSRDVLNLKARLARDVSYSQFYSAFPVSQSLLEPLFLQVELLNPHSLADRLFLQDCWATLTPELDASPQWDLVTDGCLVTGDSYRTLFHPVPARTSPHLQRFEVQAQQSSKDPALWRQNDVSYVLQYRFVRMDSLGRETVYPFSLSCSTESPWNPREVVCEENYMEVSVRKNVPVIAQEGLAKEDWEAALSIAQEAVMSVWQVVFHQTGMTPKTMNAADARTEGYFINSTTSRVVFRSPCGMPKSEMVMSHVIDNKYNQMYAIDLFLEHQWADDLWEVTQHRSFKPVRSPYLPETPYVVNNTIPSEKGFTVTLGNFKPDVELKNLTINGVPLTLPEAENRGVKITEVKHPNGTKNFVLKVPFAHPLIPEQYIGDNYRRYLLNINYTLNIIPVNEPYFHPATIVCDVQDVVHPDVKGICTNTSIVFEVTPGNMDYQWELCIGEEPLTPELVARRGYTMTSQPKIRVELPLFSIGYIYEDITLRGLIGKVVLILRDMKSLKEEDRFEQRCPFPTNEMLVCMPNGVMSVLVVPMAPVPPVNLARTTLLDQNCRPSEATSDRALFTFRVNTCGTRSKVMGLSLNAIP